jgi:hypothetical protein
VPQGGLDRFLKSVLGQLEVAATGADQSCGDTGAVVSHYSG